MRRQFLLLFFGTWLIYLAFLSAGIYSIDGYSMLAVAHSIVTLHNVSVPAGLGIPGKGGLIYSSWYPLQSFLALPVVAVAVKASSMLHVPVHYVESLSVTILPALYTALTIPVIYMLALSLGSDEKGAWLAAIAYAFCTMALVYTRDFFADPLLALLMALGLLLAFRQGAMWMIFSVTALAVLAKPTGIILGPILSVYLLWKTRRFWWSLLPGIGSAAGLLLYFAYNNYRFGNFRTFGPPWAFSFRFVPQGVAETLISPGEGLFWFCPCVILSVVALAKIKTRWLEAWTIASLAAASVLLHGLYPTLGLGGWSWGPRHLLPVLPGLVALTGVLTNGWRKALAVSAILGFLLTAPNLVSFYTRYFAEANEQHVTDEDMMWRTSRSPLLHQWAAAFRQIEDARQSDVTQMVAQRTAVPASKISNSRALRIVADWWWLLPVVHVSRVWGALLAALMALSGMYLLIQAKGLSCSQSRTEEPAPAVQVVERPG